MKKTLIIMLAIAFTSMSTFAENINNGDVLKNSIKKSSPDKDCKTIKKAILKSDVKTISKFAGNQIVNVDSLIQEAGALSYIHEVLKSYKYKHLKRENVSGIDYLVFEAYTTITHSDNSVTAHIFKIFLTKNDDQLKIAFYVNVKA
jgi:hypothetical protein